MNYLGFDETSDVDVSEFVFARGSISNLGLVGSNISGVVIFPFVLAIFSEFVIGFCVTMTFCFGFVGGLLPAEICHNQYVNFF